ncbi:MAG: hypothetical protein V2A66_00615 [Pseudomonadota bacterium]
MKIIRPITLTEAMLTASNVPNVDDIGTSATALLIEVASKTFVTQAGLGFVAGEWVKAYSTATPANYMYGKVTSYSGTSLVVNMTVNGGAGTPADWKISYGWNVGAAYLAGDQVQISTGVQKIYEALVNVTGGSSPEVDVLAAVPKWLEVSATNRWKAFDQKVGSQTSQATSITYTITPGEVADAIAFLNLDAVTVRVVSTDPIEGVVYDETIDLLSTVITGISSVYDWYTYFFSAIFKRVDIVLLDLPPYLNTVLDITVIYTGGTAKVGGIVIGVQTNLGETQYSPSIGIHDYSIKEADAFGVLTVTQRAFSKKMSCDVLVESASIADVQNLLASYRSTLLVWIGSEDYPSLIIYGFFKDFNIVIGYPTFAICNIEVEGLT